MKIDRRISNGLAWAGVALVVGIPVADLLSAQFMGGPDRSAAPVQAALIAPVAPTPAPLSQRPVEPKAQVAAITPKPVAAPAKTPAKPEAQVATVVDSFIQSGRPMPSYITDAPSAQAPAHVAATPPARTPIVTTPPLTTAVPATDPIEVAAIPTKVAPMPMPLSMRPQPMPAAVVPQQAVVIPAELARPNAVVRPPIEVTSSDLENWETGPLSEFLAQQQAGNAYVAPAPQPQGFWLDEAPSRPRDRVIMRDDPFLFFAE